MDLEDIDMMALAISVNDIQTVQAIIKRFSIPDCWIPKNFDAKRYVTLTPLMFAAKKKHLEIIQLLIDANCDVNVQNESGDTALHFACVAGHLEAVELLLKAGSDIDIKNKRDMVPLHSACYGNNYEIVKLLIDSGSTVDTQASDMRTPLIIACLNNNFQIANLLVKVGCRVNIDSCPGYSPLYHVFQSTHHQDYDLIKLLLDAGADVNAGDKEGFLTPLVHACASATEEMIKLLLTKVSKPLKKEYGTKLLQYAMYNKDVKVISQLLEHGADPNSMIQKWNVPLIVDAAHRNCIELVKILLAHNCDVNKPDDNGTSALNVACSSDNLVIVRVLLDNHCNVNQANSCGNTPLHNACRKGSIDTAQLLIVYGCDVNVINNDGFSPLYYACKFTHIDLIKLLLKSGAILHMYSHESPFKASLESQKSIFWGRPFLLETNVPMLLLKAKYNLSQDYTLQPIEYYIMTFGNEIIEDNQDFFYSLLQLSHEPLSLKDLCLHYVREMFGQELLQIVNRLDIPETLKGVLVYDFL